MKTKGTRYLPVRHAWMVSNLPNFHRSGSIAGMKKQYYGMHAQLVRCGQWIYNITGSSRFHEIMGASK